MEGPIEFRIMFMSIQSGRKHPAKLNADTVLKIAHGRARTVDAVRCPAPSLAVFFHVLRKMRGDAQLRSSASIDM